MGIVAADRRHGCFHFSPRNVHVVNYPVLLACRFLVELLLQPSNIVVRLDRVRRVRLRYITARVVTQPSYPEVSGWLPPIRERVFAREQTAVRLLPDREPEFRSRRGK